MAEKEKFGSVKRFGARYGRSLKKRLAKVESVQHGKHTCPFCRSKKVKRIALGIWTCSRCSAKFAGRAYSVKEPTSKEEDEEKEEVKEETPKETEKTEEEKNV